MIGTVDARSRALLEVLVSNRLHDDYKPVTTWIDTAFDGHLVFSLELIRELALDALAETEAVLADGSIVVMDTYVCYLEWLGRRMPLQVVANEGKFPLLGTGLLEQRILHVDYVKKTLALE